MKRKELITVITLGIIGFFLLARKKTDAKMSSIGRLSYEDNDRFSDADIVVTSILYKHPAFHVLPQFFSKYGYHPLIKKCEVLDNERLFFRTTLKNFNKIEELPGIIVKEDF